MTPQQIQQLLEQYGKPAYELAKRQVYIGVGWDVFWIVLFLVSLPIAIVLVRRAYLDEKVNSYKASESGFLAAVISAIASAFIGVVALIAVSDIINVLLNPEWAVLQKLLYTVK